ncbi:MAG: hypothetical protein DRP56_01205 [Planctomycetota bacterium]|nr:MAG: hypothetical protein DRP56_01205 [Planctomycetota bacterium]
MITDLAQAIMTRFNETPAGDALRAVLTGGLWFTQAKPDQAFPYAVFRWDGSNIDEICGGQNQRLETATITVEVFSNNDDGGTEVFDAVEKFMDHFDWCELTYPSDILGDELVTNGDFAVENIGSEWTYNTPWFWQTAGDSYARIDGPAGLGNLVQTLAITSGKLYRVSFDVSTSESAPIPLSGLLGGESFNAANGSNSVDVTCGSTDLDIIFRGGANAGKYIGLNNISVKELDHRYSHIAFKRNSIVNRGKLDNIWMIEIEYEAMFSH